LQSQAKTCQKPYAKTPQKPRKNPAKIWYAKIQQKSFMISLTKNLLKTFKYLQKLPNFTFYNQNKKPMHELITLSYQMKCGITGTIIDKGEQAYYNHQTKTCIHPLEYEKNMSQVKIGDPKTYFTRHQKLNK
jgi:hypothetical protein